MRPWSHPKGDAYDVDIVDYRGESSPQSHPRRPCVPKARKASSYGACYRSRIMEKLGLKHRSELVRFALRTGLLKVE